MLYHLHHWRIWIITWENTVCDQYDSTNDDQADRWCWPQPAYPAHGKNPHSPTSITTNTPLNLHTEAHLQIHEKKPNHDWLSQIWKSKSSFPEKEIWTGSSSEGDTNLDSCPKRWMVEMCCTRAARSGGEAGAHWILSKKWLDSDRLFEVCFTCSCDPLYRTPSRRSKRIYTFGFRSVLLTIYIPDSIITARVWQ